MGCGEEEGGGIGGGEIWTCCCCVGDCGGGMNAGDTEGAEEEDCFLPAERLRG